MNEKYFDVLVRETAALPPHEILNFAPQSDAATISRRAYGTTIQKMPPSLSPDRHPDADKFEAMYRRELEELKDDWHKRNHNPLWGMPKWVEDDLKEYVLDSIGRQWDLSLTNHEKDQLD